MIFALNSPLLLLTETLEKIWIFVVNRKAVGSLNVSIDDEILFLLHEQHATLLDFISDR